MRTRPLEGLLKNVRRSPSASVLLIVVVAALLEYLCLETLAARGTALLGASSSLLGAVCGIVLCAVAAWYVVARPFEAALRENRHTLRSLFVENPESIAVYDLEGRIMRGNLAAAEMMKQPPEALIGSHFTHHMAPEVIEAAGAVFARAAAGGTVEFETVFLGAGGERIDVRSTLFPHMVEGRLAGVFGVAKDIGELKRSKAAYEEQAQRIAELYRVSSSRGATWKRQVEEALLVACQRLGYREGTLVEMLEGEPRPLATVGVSDEKPGSAQLEPQLLQEVVERLDLVVRDDPEFPAHSFVGVPVRLPKGGCGVIALASRESLGPLTLADRDFIRLVTALVASAVERGRQQERLDQLAFFDALTGLPNRVMVTDRLAELLGAAQWSGIPFAVHYIDLDHFKEVNDGYGHAVGDEILRLAARRMQDAIVGSDMVARLGGDEFVVVQPLPEGHAFAKALALRILAAIGQPFCVQGVYHQLGVSIGISISPNNGRDGHTLLQRADEALYRAKGEGKNRLKFAYDPESLAS